jgi:hypothetical protein
MGQSPWSGAWDDWKCIFNSSNVMQRWRQHDSPPLDTEEPHSSLPHKQSHGPFDGSCLPIGTMVERMLWGPG